ncbi:hypothetical protein [Rosenbergiella metrosideri]|uniref:hypothetical protein n=1 Tax=Rosenbergiella metrosideri TaxID=2921185 RepID=UPI001F4F24EB|nr:hypothetical protein [Rosenbergiella metrosideri]
MANLLRSIVAIFFLLGIPAISLAGEYRFTISSRNDIEQEITIAKILPFYQYMGGVIEIEWANPDLNQPIKAIINSLVKEGVDRKDIVTHYTQNISNKYQSRESVNLVLKTLNSRTYCQPYNLKNSSKWIGQESCALQDNTDAMLVLE